MPRSFADGSDGRRRFARQRKCPHRAGRLPPPGSPARFGRRLSRRKNRSAGGAFIAFAPGETNLAIRTSADGKNFQPANVERKAFPSSQTVYGYSTPILFSGNGDGGNATYLRIALREAPVEEKNENDRRSTKKPEQATVEISRVEIEFDRARKSCRCDLSRKRKKPLSSIRRSLSTASRWATRWPAIDAAAARGERQLNVVVTILVDLTEDLRIKSFGGFSGSRSAYKPCDDAMRDELKDKLRQVFARMVKHNMAIYILPHIDAGGRVRQWRNWVDFDPLESYGGYTYDDLMIGTIADALAETANDATHIEMALSGEMGTSLFRYPESYRTIVRRLRERRS